MKLSLTSAKYFRIKKTGKVKYKRRSRASGIVDRAMHRRKIYIDKVNNCRLFFGENGGTQRSCSRRIDKGVIFV